MDSAIDYQALAGLKRSLQAPGPDPKAESAGRDKSDLFFENFSIEKILSLKCFAARWNKHKDK